MVTLSKPNLILLSATEPKYLGLKLILLIILDRDVVDDIVIPDNLFSWLKSDLSLLYVNFMIAFELTIESKTGVLKLDDCEMDGSKVENGLPPSG